MKRSTLAMSLFWLGCSVANAASATAPDNDPHGPLEAMPKPLEVRFALSALPASLRPQATVYVLDPSRGYVLERQGNNGQSCFVNRMEWQFADYRNDIFAPTCYDETGAKTHMRVIFDAAAMRARGFAPEVMREQILEGFFSGDYTAPDHPGFSYMTEPLIRTYTSLDSREKNSVMTMTTPHVRYYAPNIEAGRAGDLPCPPCAPYPFVFEPGPHGYFIQRLGDQDSAKILADEAPLIRELCGYRRELCLLSGPREYAPARRN